MEAHARNTDPETSHEAAASIPADRIRASQRYILEIIVLRGPMTDEDIWNAIVDAGATAFSPSGARTRRAELVDQGLVQDSGKRRKLGSGRDSILWEAKQPKRWTVEAVPVAQKFSCVVCGHAQSGEGLEIVLGGYARGTCGYRECPTRGWKTPVTNFRPLK